jgi:lipoprotein-releasing system permease protein
MSFETFVAGRYFRAKRKQKFISVVTAISVFGVTAGVAALIVAMAINNGVQRDLQEHLMGATSDVLLREAEPGLGIEDWQPFMQELARTEHVTDVAPALYAEVMITSPIRSRGCVLKGVNVESELRVTDLLRRLTAGSLDALQPEEGFPGIVLGARLASYIGADVGTVVSVVNPQGEMTIMGPVAGTKRFRVAAIFDSGYFEYDNAWALTSLKSAQQALSLADVINALEFKLDDHGAAEVAASEIEAKAGPKYAAMSWMERNRTLFNALRVEKLVTAVTIGLIMMVAALNILISLVMMVMEKNRDIAILISMGARRRQIRKIFMAQGLLIGALGTIGGLALGHLLCWAGQTYHLFPLDSEIYGLSYVPFAPEALDGLGVAVAAIVLSYLTTIYPATRAASIVPVEVLRYE